MEIPPLTPEQEHELAAIMENTELMEFMEATLPNQGQEEADEIILARQVEAIEAFSKNPPSFWSLH